MTLTMSTAVLLVIAASSKACEICDMLGQDNVQGLKSGFMAGNKVYYVGGHYNCWRKTEDETIGLTHPFYHDLRSRGDAIAHYDSVGTGNDFRGWVRILPLRSPALHRCHPPTRLPSFPPALY